MHKIVRIVASISPHLDWGTIRARSRLLWLDTYWRPVQGFYNLLISGGLNHNTQEDAREVNVMQTQHSTYRRVVCPLISRRTASQNIQQRVHFPTGTEVLIRRMPILPRPLPPYDQLPLHPNLAA